MNKYKVLICVLLALVLVFGSFTTSSANELVGGAVAIADYLLVGTILVACGVITSEEWADNIDGNIKIAKAIVNSLSASDLELLKASAQFGIPVQGMGFANFNLAKSLCLKITELYFSLTGITSTSLVGSFGGFTGNKDIGTVSLMSIVPQATAITSFQSVTNFYNNFNYKYKIVAQFYKGTLFIVGSDVPFNLSNVTNKGNLVTTNVAKRVSLTFNSDGTVRELSTALNPSLIYLTPYWDGSRLLLSDVQTSVRIIMTNCDLVFPYPFNYSYEKDFEYYERVPVSMPQSGYDRMRGLSESGRSICVNVPANSDPFNNSRVGSNISQQNIVDGVGAINESLSNGPITLPQGEVTSVSDVVFNPSMPLTEGVVAPDTTLPYDIPLLGDIANFFSNFWQKLSDFFNPPKVQPKSVTIMPVKPTPLFQESTNIFSKSARAIRDMQTGTGSAPVITLNLHKLLNVGQNVGSYSNPLPDKESKFIDFAMLEDSRFMFMGLTLIAWIRLLISSGMVITTSRYCYKKIVPDKAFAN